ncbi:cadherin-like and PC-esterase domain-containing protein 1 [Neosynchiropus ocellatus]
MRFLRTAAGLLLRRRCFTGPLLLLLGLAVCLFYQTMFVHRNRIRSGKKEPPIAGKCGTRGNLAAEEETKTLISNLESLQVNKQKTASRRFAVVLTGRLPNSDTEVQLYQRVLTQMGYEVQLSRYAETSSFLRSRQDDSSWSLLVCLSSAESSCVRRVSFSHLQRHQKVNLWPGLMEALASVLNCDLAGPESPTMPLTCRPTSQTSPLPIRSTVSPLPGAAASPGLVAMVNVYIVVTSIKPLTSFLHDIVVVTTHQEKRGRAVQLTSFLMKQLGPQISHEALGQVKKVIGQVLHVAVSANHKARSMNRCVLCYQLLTFTLLFNGSISPIVTQISADLTFSALSDGMFDQQIMRDQILEDTFHFLLSSGTQTETKQSASCAWTKGACLSEDDFAVLLQFQQLMKKPSSFQLVNPITSSSSSLSALLLTVSCYYGDLTNNRKRLTSPDSAPLPEDTPAGACMDPQLRQIYTDPPLLLNPPFSPQVKEYHAEVTFDTLMIRIRPEPKSSACSVHLEDRRGPRLMNAPVGLGHSRISILVTDSTQPEPAIMTVYTLRIYRENRPSLPMFGDHVMCSFVQDCGLLVLPGQSCGLQPFTDTLKPAEVCRSGHQSGQWVVPCLSCSDNRTCDWREVAWQPDGCHHPHVDPPLLQHCMMDRKLLFIGDSTNRGMMYFFMERVNTSLADWGKAHDTLVYGELNGGRTFVSYSYYPQFWLEKSRRPTFRQALQQLLHRSRPLVNSNETVLVVGGVQWLNTNHLKTIYEVLRRESLGQIQVLVKSLGMGFHLRVDGIRSLSLGEVQDLHSENENIIATAKHLGYEVIDTFGITMGRYKEFLQGRCACHFHEVERLSPSSPSDDMFSNTGPEVRVTKPYTAKEADANVYSYHVRGPVNQVYSEILLSRLCPPVSPNPKLMTRHAP